MKKLSPLAETISTAFYGLKPAVMAESEQEDWERAAMAATKFFRARSKKNTKLQKTWKGLYNEGDS